MSAIKCFPAFGITCTRRLYSADGKRFINTENVYFVHPPSGRSINRPRSGRQARQSFLVTLRLGKAVFIFPVPLFNYLFFSSFVKIWEHHIMKLGKSFESLQLSFYAYTKLRLRCCAIWITIFFFPSQFSVTTHEYYRYTISNLAFCTAPRWVSSRPQHGQHDSPTSVYYVIKQYVP